MSARTLERPETETVRPSALTTKTVRRAPTAPTTPELRLETQIQPIRRRRVRKITLERTLLLTVCYAGLAFGSYLASGLGAQVASESARQSGYTSGQRGDAAMRSIESIEGRLDAMAAPGSIEKWARTHGMVHNTPAATHEETLLAQRD
ncbi:hypothetical protein BH11ARM2_BH11ARM2_17010 [soil metagenome]